MADLGVIQEDVQFDWVKAGELSAELRATAAVLEQQVTERSSIRAAARVSWQGRYGDELDDRVATCLGDAARFAASLRGAAGHLDELARLAREEQDRRVAARDWVASQQDDDGGFGIPGVDQVVDLASDGLDAAGDVLFGEDDVPPDLVPVEPPSIPLGDPAPVVREASPASPVATYGSGGVSSASPDDLDAWAWGSRAMDQTIANRKGSLDGLHADFTAVLGWGTFDATSLLAGLGTWLSLNETDALWVTTIAQAFRAAGTGRVPDAAIAGALARAGLGGVGRLSVTYDDPVVWGEPPTSGYADDPVNTASGNFVEAELDLDAGGLCRLLRFARTYNSRSDRVGPFGRGWGSWASVRLRAEPDGAHWVGPDGQEAVLPRAATGRGLDTGGADGDRGDWGDGAGHTIYARVPGVPGQVVVDGDGLVLEGFDGASRMEFDGAGRPRVAAAGPGTRVELSYDDGGRLVTMEHEGGRSLALVWSDDGRRVVGLRCSDGRRVAYRYDGEGRLVEVDGGPTGRRRYELDGDGRVVAVVDADDVVEARNSYDGEGRVVAQESPYGRRTRYRYLPGGVTVVDDDAGGPVNHYVHDDHGRLLGVVDGHGNELSKRYDRWGNPIEVVERDGTVTRFEWEDRSRLVRRQAADGAWFRFAYDGAGRTVEVTASTGATTWFRYEGDERSPVEITDPEGGVTRLEVAGGLVRRVVDPDGVEVRYGFDDEGQLTSVTDAAGNVARVERDAVGRVTATVSPSGRRTELTYDAAGRPVSRRDPSGAVTRFEWSPAGRLLAVVDPSGARRELRYGAHGAAEELVDELGFATTRRYDSLGNLVGIVLPDGAKWELDYDRLCRLTGISDPAGATWLREHDAAGNLVGTVDPLGAQRSVGLDEAGRIVGVDDGATSVAFELDELGRATVHRRPDGTEAQASYDRGGRIVAVTDPDGGVTRYSCTPAGRLAAVVSPLGHTSRYEYDSCGRRVAVADPLGHRWSYRYDADGRVTQVVAPTGETTRLRYDGGGRLVARVSSRGGTTRYEHDACGRVVAVIDPAGGVTRFVWDPRGQLVEAVDPNGGVTRYERDERGRLRTLVDPLGGRVEHRYDPAGRLVERRDQLGRSTHWEYDPAGRLVRRMLPSGDEVRWWYDPSGRVAAVGRGDEQLIRIERDLLGRPVVVDEASPASLQGNGPIGAEDLQGNRPFRHELEWNRQGRLVARRRNGLGLTWRYDADGRRIAVGYPDGTETTFDHDAAGRPTSATHPALGTVTFGRDAAGRLVRRTTSAGSERWTYADGALTLHESDLAGHRQFTEIDRDAAGRVVGVTTTIADADDVPSSQGDPPGSGGSDEAIPGAPPGEVSQVQGGPPGQGTHTGVQSARSSFRYDTAGQLVGADMPQGEWTFGYDAAGRLAIENGPSGDVSYRYDAAHQLVERRAAGHGRSRSRSEEASSEAVVRYAYDDAGRRVATTGPDGTARPYTWDWLGRLAGLGDTSLRVDALGDLAEVDGVPLLWDGTDAVPQLRWVDGAAVVGDRQAWPMDRGTGAGSDDAGATGLAGGGGFDPWGAWLGGPAPGLAVGYRGELHIDELLWLRNRAYDPASRSFLSTDPLPGVPGTPFAANGYHYAGNDPIGALDPLGLRPLTEAQLDRYREAMAGNGLFDHASDAWGAVTDWTGDVVGAVGDWASENWEYIVAGAMIVGGVVVMATGVGGPIGAAMIGGALLSGGISTGAQRALTGQVNWGRVGVDMVVGGLSGGAGAWAGGATATSSTLVRVGTQVGVNTATNVGGGMVSRAIEGQDPFDTQGIAIDTLTGAATGSIDSAATTLRSGNLDTAVAGVNAAPPAGGPMKQIRYGIPDPNNPNVLGETDWYGNITVRPDLSPEELKVTLRHERVHSALSPTEGTFMAEQRMNLRRVLYEQSDLYCYGEEALAEGYATGSIREGLRFPVREEYVSPSRMAKEAAVMGGAAANVAGQAYVGYETLVAD